MSIPLLPERARSKKEKGGLTRLLCFIMRGKRLDRR